MLRMFVLLLLAAGCTAEIEDGRSGDPGPPNGDPMNGDPVSGDPLVGDPTSGDPVIGDPATGDPSGGDPESGDPQQGDPGTVFWQPPPGTTWQWQLQGTLDTTWDVDVYDIDLFDTSAATIGDLHGDGRVVICYFSAGSREDWRADAGDFDTADYENPLGGWPGEHWLDTRSANVRSIMEARLDLAVTKGCDAVEPDNVDAYDNNSGFPLNATTQIDYNRFLAAQAHARGLSVGLKNAVGLVDALEPDFDWALNEECLAYTECNTLAPFLAANKAVFHVEYVDDAADGPAKKTSVCDETSIQGFSTLIKTWDLDAWGLTCD